MDLRNRRTGVLGTLCVLDNSGEVHVSIDEETTWVYSTLSSLYKEWEDTGTWGKNMQTLKLACGIEIALEDYWEFDKKGNKKTEFTFNEVLEIEKKLGGLWRVPTAKEWTEIFWELGFNSVGDVARDGFVEKLKLTVDEYGNGGYWSRTAYSAQYARSLYLYESSVNPTNSYDKYGGFSVRLVRRKNET